MDYPLHEKAVKWAMNEYHSNIHEVPMGSNRGQRVEYYQSFDFLAGGGYPWCVDFCLAAWANVGNALPYKGAGAFNYLDWAIKNRWREPLKNILAGDLVVLNIGAGHMAMFLDKSATMIKTVNGNVSDAVKVTDWKISDIRGCIHVPEIHSVPVPKTPLFIVTTSVNGHRQLVVTQRTWKRLSPLLPAIAKKRGWNGFTIKRVR